MQFSRQQVVDVLRKTGFVQLADEARNGLPDPVDSEQVEAWGQTYGVNLGRLIDRMGGSP
jgi:hypothetical protein